MPVVRVVFIVVLTFILNISAVYAQKNCLKAEGEALLVHGDRGSARLEALTQAKWYAIEQAIGVHIKSQTVIHNFALLDDTIIKKMNGVITGYKILSEGEKGNLYHVAIHACVEKAKAEAVVNKLARNTAVGTLIMLSSKRVVAEHEGVGGYYTVFMDSHSDESPLSDSLNELLVRQGVAVVSLDDVFKGNYGALERSLVQGNYSQVSRLMARSLSNVVIIGHIRDEIAAEKGRNIGYGVSMPLFRVTAYFSYRILSKAGNGRVEVLKAGKSKGTGMGADLEAANQSAMENLSAHVTEGIANGVIKHIQGLSRQIDITISGVPDSDVDQDVREQLQSAPWVMKVENISLGHYRVRYPESSLYLANTLSRIHGVKVRDYRSLSIRAEYLP